MTQNRMLVEFPEYDGLLDALKGMSGSSKATIASVLLTTSCEALASRRIMKDVARPEVRFDQYYTMKHEAAKLKLIERLKTALVAIGADFRILS